MLTSKAIDLFIACVCAGKTNSTPDSYRKKLLRFMGFVGDKEIEAITQIDVDNYRNSLLCQREKQVGYRVINEPLSIYYVRGILRTIKHFFKWLADENLIQSDVSMRMKIPKCSLPVPKAITQDTFDKLLIAANTTGELWAQARNVAMLCMLRDTGGRLGGLIEATVNNLDIKAGILITIEKGNQERVWFFNDASRNAIERWLSVRSALPVRCDKLFVGSEGNPLTGSGVRNILRRLAASAGVMDERFNAHSFRHAFARDCLKAGADLSQVSQLMGHCSITITADYYARWLPNELKQIHQRTSPGRLIDLREGQS